MKKRVFISGWCKQKIKLALDIMTTGFFFFFQEGAVWLKGMFRDKKDKKAFDWQTWFVVQSIIFMLWCLVQWKCTVSFNFTTKILLCWTDMSTNWLHLRKLNPVLCLDIYIFLYPGNPRTHLKGEIYSLKCRDHCVQPMTAIKSHQPNNGKATYRN